MRKTFALALNFFTAIVKTYTLNVGNLTLNNIKINKFQWEWKQQLERARRLQLNSQESYKMESEWKSPKKGSEWEKTQSSRMLSFINCRALLTPSTTHSWAQETHGMKKKKNRNCYYYFYFHTCSASSQVSRLF